jgi:monoamine oxidase
MDQNRPQKTVLVIGAGIAGITAALRLEACGYKVIILEARKEIGGRIRICHNVPLGPMFIHEAGEYPGEGGIDAYVRSHPDYLLTTADLPSSQPMPALLEELSIPSWETWNVDFVQNTKVVGEKSKDFDLMQFKTYHLNYRNQYVDYYTDIPSHHSDSLEDRFAKALLRTYEEAYSGLSLEELSEAMDNSKENGLDFFKYGDSHRLVGINGYYTLIKAMQQKLKNTELYLDAFVKKVEPIAPVPPSSAKSEKVKVTLLSGKQFEADALIATLPLGVLQKNEVEIVNLSAAKKSAIQNLKMGLMNTVILKFEKQFWSNENNNFIIINTSQGKRPITLLLNFNKISPELEPTLMASFFALDAMREKEILISEAKNAIKAAWPGSPDPLVEEATSWHFDPYTYGSYASFSKLTRHQDIVNLMSPEWGGRLVLAGDAIVPLGLVGCVHGAYISACRAARLIDEYFKTNR